MNMIENKIEVREEKQITIVINPIAAELKLKLKTAFQEVVSKIKEKHLS